MNEHFHEYLKKRIAWPVMSEACKHMERDDRRDVVIRSVQSIQAGYRSFVASYVWSQLGYGGGL